MFQRSIYNTLNKIFSYLICGILKIYYESSFSFIKNSAMKLIQKLSNERHIKVLIVTHDMDMLISDNHVIEMQNDKIVAKKTT
ncbi:hypothetical protein CWR45_08420 [Oceanobacillus chungangensis]|uniref:Uncharacterized protein n=1 Tax=Oceanobacillus chungangensis TaxID=1229152 RepID=A0A3D8PU62_9BACI|nr:hypothetical protein CWR45_08420 [Oceanobacillus chungangensis]